MIDKQTIAKAAEYIKKHTSATEWTFFIRSNEHLRTRFAQNGITQHISGLSDGISLEVAFDGQTGSASINDISEDGLNYMIKTAEAIAKRNQPDPEYVAPEGAKVLPDTHNFSEATEHLKAEDLVDIVEKCVTNAKAKGAKTSGMTEKDSTLNGLFTSNGFEGFYKHTSFSHSMTMKKGGVETKINRSMLDYKDFNVEEIINKLNQQFDSLSDPSPIKPGKIPVIMRPAAVADWFMYLFWMLDRRSADEGITPYSGQLGKQFFGKDFTMRSRLDQPGLMAPPFTRDGMIAKDVYWINKGVIKTMTASRYYAQKIGTEAVQPYNIYMEGGNASEKEMMKMVPRGVILNKLWYIRNIDRKAGTQTGLTRDGVLYFEDGEIKGSVNNFRWNEILHDVTRRIMAIGTSELIETWCQVPTLLINDFNFVDTTSF